MTNMAAMPIQGKNLYKSFLLNQWIDFYGKIKFAFQP